MVTTPGEVRRARAVLEEAKAELATRRIPFDPAIKVGVMIEVPGAALVAGDIAAESDFLSIGTNDLIQYLLAVDRGNSSVASLYEEFNPAVIRVIRDIIAAGHKQKTWVGMCGEMAGDPLATVLLIGLGLDEFSVVPTVLPEIKKIIRTIRYRDARKIAERALALSSAEEIRELLTEQLRQILPELPLADTP
jgi:phosphotransferase system enzyme I (PtsI)